MDGNKIKISKVDLPENRTNGVFTFGNSIAISDGFLMSDVSLEIKKGTTDEIVLEERSLSRGRTYDNAKMHAENIHVDIEVEDNEIKFPSKFRIGKDKKIRRQEVSYTMYVPVGTTIEFGDDSYWFISRNTEFKSSRKPSYFNDYPWTMSDEGLVSTEWNNVYKAKKEFLVEDLKNLNIDGSFHTIIKSGKEGKITLKGTKKNLGKVDVITTENNTSIVRESNSYGDYVYLEIEAPNLEVLGAKSLSELDIHGLKSDKLEINYSGRHDMNAVLDVDDLLLNVSGENKITLSGSGNKMKVNLLGGTRMIAEQYKCKEVEVTGSIYSKSSFYATEDFVCPPSEVYDIKLFGEPNLLTDLAKN